MLLEPVHIRAQPDWILTTMCRASKGLRERRGRPVRAEWQPPTYQPTYLPTYLTNNPRHLIFCGGGQGERGPAGEAGEAGAGGVATAGGAGPPGPQVASFLPLLLSSLELSDTKVYEPEIRVLLGTASFTFLPRSCS